MKLMSKYKKSLLFLLSAALIGGVGYVVFLSDIQLKLPKTVRADGPIQCDFNGITYQEGQVRAAGDGCNTCVCSETGWSCTKIACFNTGEKLGTISGTIKYPEEKIPALLVCAVNLKTEKKQCVQTLPNTPSYALRVPEGDYWVYSKLEDDPVKRKAWYSEFLECGLLPECKDHSPVTVAVMNDEIAEAHPNDWYATGWVESFNMTPTNRKYGSTYHYNDGVFSAKTKKMTSVEVWYLFIRQTANEPDDTVPKLVGKAELVKSDNGYDFWELDVPNNFDSSHVWAVGYDETGSSMKSWDIGWVKPDQSVL